MSGPCMQVWPAIDLRDGKCVRLAQGDYAREIVFGENPSTMARHWVNQGAERLHLVDLDGARDGRQANLECVRSILLEVDVPCQLGGGVRSSESIESLLELGLARLIVGTQALKDPDWFRAACRKHPGRMVLGIDARDGRVATDGWLNTSSMSAVELAALFESEPLAGIVCTDISRDGMMAGPNIEAMRAMQAAVNVPVIASGGVSCADDVANLAEIPMAGVIVGRALYEGKLSLADALAAADCHRSEKSELEQRDIRTTRLST